MSFENGVSINIHDTEGEGFPAEVQRKILAAAESLCENTRDRISPFSDFELVLGCGVGSDITIGLSAFNDDPDRDAEDYLLAREFCLELGLLIGRRYELTIDRRSEW